MLIHEIRDAAIRTGRAVFSTQQLANLTGKSRAAARVSASRLVRSGLAKRLCSGKLTFLDDDRVIATQLVEPSYISLHSALLFHGLITQVPTHVQCVTTRNSIPYPDLGIIYHKIQPALFGGYMRHVVGSTYMFVAEPEKAVIDGIYLNFFAPSLVDDCKDRLDSERVSALLSAFHGKGSQKLHEVLLDDR